MACGQFIVIADKPESVLFRCDKCEREIRFVKPGFGEPNPKEDGGVPDNVTDWLGMVDQCYTD